MTAPDPGERDDAPLSSLDFATLKDLLDRLVYAPRAWVYPILLACVLSAFAVNYDTENGWAVGMQVSSVTVSMLALLWLPTLLRVIALTGGSLKSPVGEGSVGGLLANLRASSSALAALEIAEESVGEDDPKAEILREMRREVEASTERRVPGQVVARQRLNEIAEEYEQIRLRERGGHSRTARMSSLMQEVRALAAAAGYTPEELRAMAERPARAGRRDINGARAVAIQALATLEIPQAFDVLLDAVTSRRSRFEQYYALLGLERIVGRLNPSQQKDLAAGLDTAVETGQVETAGDTSRYRIVQRIKARLRS